MTARESLLAALAASPEVRPGAGPRLVVAVVAERDAQIIAWLGKKAREYQGRSGPRVESASDALARMADKIARGAVRPSTAGQAPAPQTAVEESSADTLPAWLSQRFDPRGPAWDALPDDDRAYWEHEARAVRRAVVRDGFKTPARDGDDCTCEVLAEEERGLTEAEGTMLAFALDLAQDRIYSSDEFTADDQAAVESLRRLATRRLDDDGRCRHCRRTPERCDATGCGSRHDPAPEPGRDSHPAESTQDAPARSLPQIAIPCPRCGTPATYLCTSHNGTRLRKYDTHQERSAAWAAKDGDAR